MKKYVLRLNIYIQMKSTLLCLILTVCGLTTCPTVYGEKMQSKEMSKVQTKELFVSAECFDKIWQTINVNFWDPNFNGVDWEDTGNRYRPKALAAKNHESFAIVVNQMLAELKTSHTYYYTKWDPEYYIIWKT